MIAYSCRSILLLLVNGGRHSSIWRGSVELPWVCGQRIRLISTTADLVEASPLWNECVGEDGRLCEEGLERRGGVPIAFAIPELLLKDGIAFGRGWRYAGGRRTDWAIFSSVCHHWICFTEAQVESWVSPLQGNGHGHWTTFGRSSFLSRSVGRNW